MKYNFRFLIWLGIFLIVFLMYKFVNKDSLIEVIFQNLLPREAALMAGMVFGDKNNFDSTTLLNFRDSGVIHIMVVSGTNIVLVFRGLMERLALPLLKYILLIVDWLSSFKWASVDISFNWWWAVGWYLILISKFLISKSKNNEA